MTKSIQYYIKTKQKKGDTNLWDKLINLKWANIHMAIKYLLAYHPTGKWHSTVFLAQNMSRGYKA